MSPMGEELFDLYGYTVIRQALVPAHVAELYTWIDALPPLEPVQWHENVYTQSDGGVYASNMQDSIDGSPLFEQLIDHPAWIDKVRRFLGPSTKPYIYEVFVNVRAAGGYIGTHSGGHNVDHHQRSGRRNGQWVCSMLSLLA